MTKKSNTLVVQEARTALQQLKFEVSQELGIEIPQDDTMATWQLAMPEPSEVTLSIAIVPSYGYPGL